MAVRSAAPRLVSVISTYRDAQALCAPLFAPLFVAPSDRVVWGQSASDQPVEGGE